MPAQVFGNQALAVQLYVAFNGVAPSNPIYENYLATMASSSPIALADQIGDTLASVSNADLATRVLTNIGVTAATTNAAAYAALLPAVTTLFAAFPNDRGVIVHNLVKILTGLEGNATYGAAAAAFNATTLSAYTYASNPVNTQPSDSSFFNTYILTANTDVASANIFQAPLVFTPGGDDRINSLQDEDRLTGTGTNPTLNATLGNANDNGATIITPTLIGVAELNLAFTGSGALAVTDIDLQDASGVAEINVTRISQASNVAEVGNMTNAAARLSLANTNANTLGGVAEFSYAAGVLAGEQAGDLELSNVQITALNVGQNTSGIGARGVAGQGFETLNLVSSGAAANTVGTLTSPMDTNTTGKVTISGTAGLTLGARGNIVNAANAALVEVTGVWTALTGLQGMGGRVATVDASAMTGNVNLVLDNMLDVGKADTSGVVQNVTVLGGKGNDTFVLYDAVQAGDSINGGDGTDTLQFYNGSSIASVAGSIESANMQLNGALGAVASTVDFDFLPNVTGMTVRNITNFGGVNFAGAATTFTMYDLNAAQAAGITVQHSTTGNGQIANTIIEAAVKANTAADLVGVTIGEGTNVDPRFNFTIDTRAANTATSTTAGASRFESVTLTDSDTESNSVELQNFADHTGTITLTGGVAGTFLNLDVDTAGADVAAGARFGTSLVVNTTAGATGVQQGLYALDTGGLAVDFAAGNIVDVGALATQVRVGAATVAAGGEASNVFVRVGTNAADANGAQSITMGSGNDTVIFDLLNDARAGLTISDTVVGGAGSDSLAIDGNGTRVSLGASEWTNVSAFETVRLVGNGAAALSTLIGQNSYNLTLTDALIAANKDATTGLLAIVNDNDSNNDALATTAAGGGSTGENTTGTGAESGVTIDARSLSATSHFSYNGEEGGWLDANANGTFQIGEIAGAGTVDKFVFGDANINGGNVIDGGAVDNNATTFAGNTDVFEVRNTATVTTGDLANVRNIGIIAGSNDQATVQTLVLQLNDNVVDAMVDSYHTSSTTERETLVVRMNAAADVTPVALAALDMDVSQLTGKSIVTATLDAAGARDNVKMGMGLAAVTLFDSGAAVTNDTVTLSASQFGIAAGAVGTTVTASGSNIIYGALGTGAITDRIYVVEGAAIAGFGGGGADTGIYYDADGSGVGAAVLIGVLVDVAVTLAAGSGLTIVA